MTINELHIQLDLQPENKINILKIIARKCSKGYLFVDSNDSHCYLFDADGNEDDVKKLTTINSGLFYNSNIESIIIPDSVKRIGDYTFAECKSLKSIKIPNSVKNIEHYTFAECKSLKSIKIPNSVKNIEHGAFKYCISLTSIAIPDSVERIGNYAFEYCRSLKSVEIPDSVERIGHRAFWNCEKLKSLIFKGKTMKHVKEMKCYPFGIEDESIISCC